MSGVNVPNSRPNIVKTAVPMALGIVGGMYGGTVGAAAGTKIGQGLVGGGRDPGSVQQRPDAIGRRVEQTAEDPQAEIIKAQQALKNLPPEDQQRFGPVLDAARQRAQQGGNV